MIKSLVIAAFACMMLAKLGDVLSTIERVKTYRGEMNPIVSPIMKRFGVKSTAWMVWTFESAVNAVLAVLALSGAVWVQVLYIVYGMISTVVLVAVVHTNYVGRFNPITRVVANVFYWMSKRG